jgi:hypothetical protein
MTESQGKGITLAAATAQVTVSDIWHACWEEAQEHEFTPVVGMEDTPRRVKAMRRQLAVMKAAEALRSAEKAVAVYYSPTPDESTKTYYRLEGRIVGTDLVRPVTFDEDGQPGYVGYAIPVDTGYCIEAVPVQYVYDFQTPDRDPVAEREAERAARFAADPEPF